MARIIQTADLDPRKKLDRATNDWVYNGLDCAVTLEIRNELLSQVDETARRTYKFSLALQAPVLEMTLNGILINQQKLRETLELIRLTIKRISSNLDRILNEGIGIDLSIAVKAPAKYWRSDKQLNYLFYEVLGLKPIRKRNSNGQFVPTVNRDAIERLASNFYAEPICKHILTLRDLDKKRSSLETGLDEDGRFRSNWNIAGTNTGRFASSESDFGTGDNSQNVNRALREIYIADPGMKLANLDLEQADARNVGAICWDLFQSEYGAAFAGSYLDACESGDLHTYVCKLVWPELSWNGDNETDRAIADQLSYREFSYRDCAKRTGHGSNYLGLVNVSRATGIPMKTLELFQTAYFGAFPCISLWQEWVPRQIKDFKYIESLMGRRRYFFGRPNDKNVIREAVAFEPQSITADQINTGLLKLWRGQSVRLLAQVHDSVLFEYPEELEADIIPWAIQQLTHTIQLTAGRSFTMPVEAKVGWNWGERTEKDGKVTNYHGLIKYKGEDNRTCPRYKNKRYSFFKMVT